MVEDQDRVVTVTGRIDPDELGLTLPHEHTFADWREKFSLPDSAPRRALARRQLTSEDLWFVRLNQSSHRDNLRLDSMDVAVDEVGHFRDAGGDTIVDVTPKSVGGDPERVRAVARETGVTFVQGTAYYTRDAHPDRIDDMSVEDIAEEFERDVVEGIDGTDVRAGIIGEIGVTDASSREETGIGGEFHDAEVRVLRGGARAAVRTGASISVHPPFQRTEEWPTSRRCHEILDIAAEEGLPPERVVLCHRDQSKWLEADLTYQRELAERGAYVEFDLFGHQEMVRPNYDDAQPSDTDRVKWVIDMIEAGHGDRLLLSHDVFLKYCLRKYGGFGYAHILESVVPWLRGLSVSREAVDQLIVDNPREVLTFAEPER